MATRLSRSSDQTPASNGAMHHVLSIDPAEFRAKAERAVTDLAHSLSANAVKQQKLAKKRARALYRTSSMQIKRNPWRTVGIALLVGAVAATLFTHVAHSHTVEKAE